MFHLIIEHKFRQPYFFQSQLPQMMFELSNLHRQNSSEFFEVPYFLFSNAHLLLLDQFLISVLQTSIPYLDGFLFSLYHIQQYCCQISRCQHSSQQEELSYQTPTLYHHLNFSNVMLLLIVLSPHHSEVFYSNDMKVIHRTNHMLFLESFNRFLIISLDVLICRYSPLFRAFPALFISEEPHKSFYYPLCCRSQK